MHRDVFVSPVLHLQEHAQKNPDGIALVCGERWIAHSELDRTTTVLAKWLLNQGLQSGDRVAIHWTNSIEAVQLLFGAFKAGLIAVTVNTRLKPVEIEFILSHSGARLCFSEPILAAAISQVKAPCGVLSQVPDLQASGDNSELPTLSSETRALIIYTSGSTARPKGTLHSHRSLYYTGLITQELWQQEQDPDKVELCVLPLMHMAALATLLASVHTGTRMQLLPRFDPEAVLDAIAQLKRASVACMPALWYMILAEQVRNPRNVSGLENAISGGDSAPVALQAHFSKVFGTPLREAYGMTESVPVAFVPRDHVRPGSFGKPAPYVKLRIVNASGEDVSRGDVGEVLASSPATFVEYWNDAAATKAAFHGEWLRTGDLASEDEDGFHCFHGRLKEIIVRGGSNISPQEVEEVLYQHPQVKEVGVVGQHDEVYGEVVTAFVVLRDGIQPDAAELTEFSRKSLADYKVPQSFIFLDELPKSPTGKVHRRLLKERLLVTAAGH